MENLPAPVDELVRVYAIHQKNLEKAREKSKTDEAKAKNRENAKRFYERHKAEVLARRHLYYEENRDTLKQKYREAYHKRKATETPAAVEA